LTLPIDYIVSASVRFDVADGSFAPFRRLAGHFRSTSVPDISLHCA